MEEEKKHSVIDINYNSPLLVKEIFRYREDVRTGETRLNDEGDLVDETEMKLREFSRDAYVLWENIREIGGYPYKDDWSIKGEKYFIKFQGSPNEMLILGNMKQTVSLWKLFRNLYPMFPSHPGMRITATAPLSEEEQKEAEDQEEHGADEDGMI